MINSITLTDFRNHASCRIETDGHKNIIITGPNGAGKTAVLEALSMLSGDRGMRGAPMTDVARFGGLGGFSIFSTLDDDSEISVFYNNGDTNRHAKMDGDTATLGDLAKKIRMVWITPREDRIFVEGSAERRSFFDRLAAGFDPAHVGRTARYTKLISERAGALRNNADTNWLDALDEQIAGCAVSIAAARIQYAGEINYFLTDAAVSVSGIVESAILEKNAADAERFYLDYLRNNRTLVYDKMVIDGVNKSDFGIFNKKLNLPANLTSTGQQKTTLIDLILAHAKLLHTKTNNHPIILLDEAAAHLDENARKDLFAKLGAVGAQVWATGIDANTFRSVPDAKFVACHNGGISNIIL